MSQKLPTADVWATLHKKLHRAWEESGGYGSPPPVPLVADGRGISEFEDRHERWQQTVQWAVEHGLQHLIPKSVMYRETKSGAGAVGQNVVDSTAAYPVDGD